MSVIFLEFRPLCSEKEFSQYWRSLRNRHKKEGLIMQSDLFKVREGLFLGQVEFENTQRSNVLSYYDSKESKSDTLQGMCKSIRMIYTAIRVQ
ncbi:MAG TPA: hypothetical protein DCG83_06320 [Cryomorphaceae bacterium]|nr:hypothetical protein [Cryomorphaceae bacterium]